MSKASLDLRGKILFGSFLLIIPLGVALAFVYQFGSAQIVFAQQELRGMVAATPLMDAVFARHIDGLGDAKIAAGVDAFATEIAGEGKSLVPGTSTLWTAPEALKQALSQDGPEQATFAANHQKLIGDVLVLADTSGLILDPDLDSLYAILALYQTVPNLLEKLTDLRPLTQVKAGRLSDQDRLLLYSRARELQSQVGTLKDQVSRSTAAVPQPIPGYIETVNALVKTIEETTLALAASAGDAVLGGAFDPNGLEAETTALHPLVRDFYKAAAGALGVMLQRRLSGAWDQLNLAFVLAGLGLVLGGTVLVLVVAGIRRRVFALAGALGTLAQNDLSREISPRLLASGDELGKLARSVKLLQTELRNQVHGIESALTDLSEIGSHLGATSEQSSASLEEMSAITTSVARSAGSQSDQTTNANRIVSDMVGRIGQSNDLTQGMATQFFLFSQSMEANRNRIREAATEAQTSRKLADGLARTGDEGEKSVENLRKSIQGVVQKTGEIQEIVKFILDISDRTNLLSMNAAIEAAHAGTSGRGFSIVADEIRKLAETSSKQAQTIQGLLNGITGVVDKTLLDSENTARSFQTLRQDIATVRNASLGIAEKMAAQEAEDDALSTSLQKFAEFYAQLSAAMDAQITESRHVGTALQSLESSGQEISLSMQEQKIGMEQSTDASIQVRETALNLAQVIGVLEAQVSRFKT